MAKTIKYKTEIVLQTTCGATTTIKSTYDKDFVFANYNNETNICNVYVDENSFLIVNLNNVCFATVRDLGKDEQ